MGNRDIEIKQSRIEGLGLFAARDFKKGEKIYSFPKGKIVRATEIQSLPEREKRYLDKLGKDKFEIIEPPARYTNHSCSPNIIEEARVGYAWRNIKKGEELTLDYVGLSQLNIS